MLKSIRSHLKIRIQVWWLVFILHFLWEEVLKNRKVLLGHLHHRFIFLSIIKLNTSSDFVKCKETLHLTIQSWKKLNRNICRLPVFFMSIAIYLLCIEYKPYERLTAASQCLSTRSKMTLMLDFLSFFFFLLKKFLRIIFALV